MKALGNHENNERKLGQSAAIHCSFVLMVCLWLLLQALSRLLYKAGNESTPNLLTLSHLNHS